jgi:hypothetical protein
VSLLVQPVTFFVSSSSTEPVEVRVSHSGLRMMLVNRESVGLLDDSWAVLGVYFLLGPFEDGPDLYRAYVGEVGKRTLLLRVKERRIQTVSASHEMILCDERRLECAVRY